MCGEKSRLPKQCLTSGGSPPRVRGKATANGLKPFSQGITPACAGKSISLLVPHLLFEDHPRVCGEKAGPAADIRRYMGSPPRVRGKDDFFRPMQVGQGITPACAGKSNQLFELSVLLGDHPRVCGEKTKKSP